VLAAALDAVQSHRIAIILDDYHVIESTDVVRLTEALIRELPETIALVILSREQPRLALGRLRLNGLVREITEAELRFAQAEVQELVNSESAILVSEIQIDRLTQRTEGWIAGIRLALLAAENSDAGQREDLVAEGSAHQWLDEYVVEEVVNHLAEDLKRPAIGDPLRLSCVRTSLTHEELARRSGIGARTITRIESGIIAPGTAPPR
jgi:LuxR family maltose regulon positive regulatory protein